MLTDLSLMDVMCHCCHICLCLYRHDYYQRKITEKKQLMAEKAQKKTQWV